MDGFNAILSAPDTELRDILLEGHRLLRFDPGILSCIGTDLESAAKRTKAARLADRRWQNQRTPCLFESAGHEVSRPGPIVPSELELSTGRGRLLDEEAVFLLMLCRGHLHSITTPSALDRLHDSVLISDYLDGRGLSLPARSTLWSYLDAVSPETRRYIDLALVRHICAEDLDDMSRVAIDSFSVKADSAWPTDSGVLLKLLARAFHAGVRIEKLFGVPGFTTGWVPGWLKSLKSLDFSISCSCGKPNSRQAADKLYGEALCIAGKIIERLGRQLQTLKPIWDERSFMPSEQTRYERHVGMLFDALGQAARVCDYARERIFEGKSRPAAEKILSVSDHTAAYIKKGGREALVGYKPQVLRTAAGFVTVAELLAGNPADAARLVPVVKQHVTLTGVVPSVVTADDGYTSRAARATLMDMGVEVVSFSGSKGRRLIPTEQWSSEPYAQARNARSAVESVIWVLRCSGGLYRFGRRGLEAVRIELHERVLIYNLSRCALIRTRKAESRTAPTAA